MAVSIGTLRALGSSRVIVSTPEGNVTGRLMTDALGDRAIVALLVPDGGDASEPLVIDVERISRVVAAE